MALLITMEPGDRVLMTGGIVIEVRRRGKFPQLSIDAPRDVQIAHEFADPQKQAVHEMRYQQRRNRA